MELAGTTIRELFIKHLDNKGNALLHSMEHTNTSGVYRLLFDETNTSQVDMRLATIDDSLDALRGWDNPDAHFRYHRNKKSEHRWYPSAGRTVRPLEEALCMMISEDKNTN
jgi:hypothetical protein